MRVIVIPSYFIVIEVGDGPARWVINPVIRQWLDGEGIAFTARRGFEKYNGREFVYYHDLSNHIEIYSDEHAVAFCLRWL